MIMLDALFFREAIRLIESISFVRSNSYLRFLGFGIAVILVVFYPVQKSYADDCDDINELLEYGIIGEEGFTYGSNSEINDNDITLSGNTPTPTGQTTTIDEDFPLFDPTEFPVTGGTDPPTNTLSISAGNYGSIYFDKNNLTAVFTGGDYYITSLQSKMSITLQLAPGNYFIDTTILENNTTLIISPEGRVNLYIGSSLTNKNQLACNIGGATGNLVVYLYDGASFSTGNGNNTTGSIDFNGIIYSPYENTTIAFGNSNDIIGAILSEGTVDVGQNTTFDYSDDIKQEVGSALGCEVTTSVDHYQLSLPTSSISCLPTTVTVTACADDNTPCTKSTDLNGETATLTTNAGFLDTDASPTETTVTFDATGEATAVLKYPTAPDGTTVSVTLSGESISASEPRQCCPNGTSCADGDSCSTTFKTAGFIISDTLNGNPVNISTQEAGTSSSTYYLRAVQTNSTTQACEAPLLGTQSIDFGYECNNPATCYGSDLMSIDGGTDSTIARNNNGAVSNYTAVDLIFDSNGNAPFTLNYLDVGQVTLYATTTLIDSDTSAATTLSGNSNAFVVKPADFVLTIPGNPAAADADDATFKKAGEAFNIEVTAYNSQGGITYSYGRESSPESVGLEVDWYDPTDASNWNVPALAGSFNDFGENCSGVFDSSLLGTACGSFSWPEVGIIDITPDILDNDYLGTGDNVTGTASGNVGRFYPHHFTVSANVPTLLAACSGFSYLDQPLNYGTQPVLTITARNRFGVTTTNYQGDWWKLGDIAETYVDTVKPATVSIDSALASHLPPTTQDHGSAGQVVTTFDGPLAYQRPVGSHAAPFNADMSMSVVVDDGDASYDDGNPFVLPLPFDPAENNIIRHGRLLLNNAYGSELLPLSLPLSVEYFDGSSFIPNTLDSCTLPVLGQFTFSSPDGIADADSVTGVGGGTGSLDWTNPPYPEGYVDVTVTLSPTPWLRFDWDDDGSHDDDPPGVRATFGIFKGNPRLIYMRESVW